MKVVAFLPAKGTSERIENKNVSLLDGKPLFLHNLKKLIECDFIDEVYLDSESDMIFDLASEMDCKYMRRDPALATNQTDGHQLLYHEACHVEADIYIQMLCTSPFIHKRTIRKGVEILKAHTEYDSVVLVRKEKQYLWSDGQPQYDKSHIPNSFNLPDTLIETMGLYIVRKEVALQNKMRFGDRCYLLEADALEAVDVNYPDDFALANYLAAGMREKERQLFRNIGFFLTSSVLSDILDDLGVDGLIRGLSLNMPEKKILGRANTLKLRELHKGEEYEGIYKALDSYKTIVPNDVIVVENACPEYAYFGDLNAAMAIRAGAISAIIHGYTRDFCKVKALDFPVFAKGNVCRDVRKRATIESINKKVQFGNVTIRQGDLIFGDYDGVIVIPKNLEEEVLQKAFASIHKEQNILSNITLGNPTEAILNHIGEF